MDFIYENDVTYMELICASPVHPTMLSFQLDLHTGSHTYSGDNLQQFVHNHEGITGASGNVTGFIMPWEKILRALHSLLSLSLEDPTWPGTLGLD